jgi:hypothetical protein
MPVRKFRSIEEMKPPWREPGSSQLDRAIRRVLELGSAMTDRRFPPGIYRFRTIEEANQFGAEYEKRLAQLREHQGKRPSPSDTTPKDPGSRTP